MSWGTDTSHTHDYAERQHHHYRGDVSDVAEEYHNHNDLKEFTRNVRDDGMETWNYVQRLERTVRGLRSALVALIAEGPETAAAVLEQMDVEANR